MIKLNRKTRRYLLKIAEEGAEVCTAVAKLLLWRDEAAWKHLQEELTDFHAAMDTFARETGNKVQGGWLDERYHEKIKKIKEQCENN